MMNPDVLEMVSAAAFQETVEGMLNAFGWSWVHHRAGRTKDSSYTVAVKGSASRGFPDLFCVRGPEALALELKKQDGTASPEQVEWISRLNGAGIEARTVRPSDTDWIEARLRRRPKQLTITSSSSEASWTK